jgi:hypothetical protein
LISQALGNADALLEELAGGLHAGSTGRPDEGEVPERLHLDALVAARLGDGQSLLVVPLRARQIVGPPRQPAGGAERAGTHCGRGVWRGEERIKQLSPLPDRPAQLPEAPERAGQPDAEIGVTCLDRPLDGPPQVGALPLAAVQPCRLLVACQLPLRLLCKRHEEAQQPPVGGPGVEVGLQPFTAILRDGLQHAEPRLAVRCALLLPDEALGHECRECVEDG